MSAGEPRRRLWFIYADFFFIAAHSLPWTDATFTQLQASVPSACVPSLGALRGRLPGDARLTCARAYELSPALCRERRRGALGVFSAGVPGRSRGGLLSEARRSSNREPDAVGEGPELAADFPSSRDARVEQMAVSFPP